MSGKDTVFCEVFPGSFFLFQRIRVLRMGSARCGVLFRKGKDMYLVGKRRKAYGWKDGERPVPGVPDRKKGGKGKEPLPRLCRNLGLHSGWETGKMPRHGASCGGKPSGFLHE